MLRVLLIILIYQKISNISNICGVIINNHKTLQKRVCCVCSFQKWPSKIYHLTNSLTATLVCRGKWSQKSWLKATSLYLSQLKASLWFAFKALRHFDVHLEGLVTERHVIVSLWMDLYEVTRSPSVWLWDILIEAI